MGRLSRRETAGFGAYARLALAAAALARADALAPRELDDVLPPGPRTVGRVSRLFAGPAARRGRPGERLAEALEHGADESTATVLTFGYPAKPRRDPGSQSPEAWVDGADRKPFEEIVKEL